MKSLTRGSRELMIGLDLKESEIWSRNEKLIGAETK